MHGVNYSEVQRIFANVDKEKGEKIVSEDSEEAPETDENVAKNSAKERQKKGADTAANQPGQPVGSTPKDVNKQREKRAQDQARVWTMADGSEARDVIESVVRTGELSLEEKICSVQQFHLQHSSQIKRGLKMMI